MTGEFLNTFLGIGVIALIIALMLIAPAKSGEISFGWVWLWLVICVSAFGTITVRAIFRRRAE